MLSIQEAAVKSLLAECSIMDQLTAQGSDSGLSSLPLGSVRERGGSLMSLIHIARSKAILCLFPALNTESVKKEVCYRMNCVPPKCIC